MNGEEPPIWLTALTRAKNKEFLGDGKGDVWVCTLERTPWSKKANCVYCGKDCYYTEDCLDLLKKDAKKICLGCAFEKHGEDMSEDAKKLLRRAGGV